jgi:hypothetical protein
MAAPAPAPAPAAKRFTGAEDRKREEIIAEMKSAGRVSWAKVVEKMKEADFPARTAKSVRNRHLRLRWVQIHKPQQRNRCRLCGQWQRGHVCGGRVLAE